MNDIIVIENNKNEKENEMNETKLPKMSHESNEQTITTLEIAEMMEVRHDSIMRKLDGRTEKGKHIKGYVEILNDHQMVVVDFFTKSTYKDGKGEMRPCYNVTKLGCEFLANKFTGEKGVLFTAKYVKRFHEMEDFIKREEKSVQAFTRKLYQTSSTPIPRNPSFYERNRRRMERLCKHENVPLSRLYYHILKRVGEEYDMEAAERIYEGERGVKPVYPMDMVNYFSDLSNLAEIYLDKLEKFTFG